MDRRSHSVIDRKAILANYHGLIDSGIIQWNIESVQEVVPIGPIRGSWPAKWPVKVLPVVQTRRGIASHAGSGLRGIFGKGGNYGRPIITRLPTTTPLRT